MKLVVVGSGYVGLVSGACFAEMGHEVVCVDRDHAKIAALRSGVTPIFEPGLAEMIGPLMKKGRLRFETDLTILGDAETDAVFIAVGTPPRPGDQGADLTSLHAVAAEIAEHARGPLVVVTKSTVPVGTGDAIERIIREAAPDLEVSVASNPEFLREGEAIADFLKPDRVVVGAEDDRARAVLQRLYAPLGERGVELIFMRRRGAELVKYASNAFLVTKISFINEIADLCEAVDADISEVARGVGADRRIGAAFLTAGPGYGGSCFPKDCAALLNTAQEHAVDLRIVESAINANHSRKRVMARRVINAMGGDVKGASIAILGLTFKANTDDMRDAPSIGLVESLRLAGARVRVYDPQGMVHARPLLGEVDYCVSALDCCTGADAVVLATEWAEFRELSVSELARVARGRVFVDLRNLMDPKALTRAGFTVHGIGRRPTSRPSRPLDAANADGAELSQSAAPAPVDTGGRRKMAQG